MLDCRIKILFLVNSLMLIYRCTIFLNWCTIWTLIVFLFFLLFTRLPLKSIYLVVLCNFAIFARVFHNVTSNPPLVLFLFLFYSLQFSRTDTVRRTFYNQIFKLSFFHSFIRDHFLACVWFLIIMNTFNSLHSYHCKRKIYHTDRLSLFISWVNDFSDFIIGLFLEKS